VCVRAPVEKLVFVNAMIPVPGELVGAWWENTGATDARIAAAERAGYPTDLDEETYFLHDISPALVAKAAEHRRAQSEHIFSERCVFGAWPNVPIHVLAGRDDRFFPVDFQRRVARERLGVDVDVLPGGHLLALANPGGLAGRLLSY
jgi:pimeloyl-ACP methyl ester carboxylesterase